MSVAEHFDALSVYQAAAVRIEPHEGDPEDLLLEGGGLEVAFERVGQRPLVGVLRDPHVRRVMLVDGDLQVSVERQGDGGRLRVAWGEVAILDERVAIPPLARAGAGPWFRPDPSRELRDVVPALHDVAQPIYAVRDMGGRVRWFTDGTHGHGVGALELVAHVRPVDPGALGSEAFRRAHGVRLAYVGGAMAGGIASPELVLALARAGLLGFYGAGGVPLDGVEAAVRRIAEAAEDGAWGANLLHNPVEPSLEERTVDLYLKYGVRRISASAYMGLTPAVVRYRLTGLSRGPSGSIVRDHHVFAKVSRPEVAAHFLRPAPEEMIQALLKAGHITEDQAELGRLVPVAEDLTAEADSGGHTDHRPLLVLLPVLQRLRDRVAREEGYGARGIAPRIGAAGGLGTPAALWAAFAMGADYVLTGSVNQATVEAGTSPEAKAMLAEAAFYDVASGPAPDMFELGAKVQVLSRGTMYARRAQRLYDLWKAYPSLEALPDKERARVEKQLFKRPIDDVWAGTRDYWASRDPRQVEKAEADPHHKMALTFRWYLGMTSRWARTGEGDRRKDYQVWCGPAMGAFNDWVAGSPLEPVEARTAVATADALMIGAAAHARIAVARALGAPVPAEVDAVGVPSPREV